MNQRYFERIGFSGDSEPLIAEISEEFNLGSVQNTEVLTVGFEDCNIKLNSRTGDFVLKAFAKFRDNTEIERYVGVMQAAINGGVHCPRLHKSQTGDVLYQHPSGISLVVMDFIDGQTYFDIKTTPTDEELNLVAVEAVKIHNLPIRPSQVLDSWAIPHIHTMYAKTGQFLDEEGKKLAEQAINRYNAIDQSRLNKCFVHGDIISTNTLKGRDGQIWILDFAVSNIYPKIQELSVIATSLLADPKKYSPLLKRVERVRKLYLSAGGTLTEYEQQVLFDYALAGAAMEFMGGHKAKFVDKEDPEESDHWIKLGKEALQEALKRIRYKK